MAIVRLNANQARTIIPSSNYGTLGLWGTQSTSTANSDVASMIFGNRGTYGATQWFIFTGQMPANFTEFTTLASRLEDLLVVIATGGPSNNTLISNSQNARFLAGVSNGSSRSLGSYSATRTNYLVTVASTTVHHGLVPGQPINVVSTQNPTFNGTFTVNSVPTTGSFTYFQIENDATASCTYTIPYAAIRDGTATWFCLNRYGRYAPSSATINANINSTFGAIMGTVGGLGSGADLEISNVNIYADTIYTSAGIYINIPYEWTV